MRLETAVYREPGEHPLPREVAIPVAKPTHRPRTEYRLRVQSEDDVDTLRRRRLPLYLLTDERVRELGYLVHFPPRLYIPSEIADDVESPFRVFPYRDADALSSPGVPETVAMLLVSDPIGARVVLRLAVTRIPISEVYRRVVNAGPSVVEMATQMRLQDFVPSLPRIGTPMSAADARWLDRNEPVRA
jgi:hypothetical protein